MAGHLLHSICNPGRGIKASYYLFYFFLKARLCSLLPYLALSLTLPFSFICIFCMYIFVCLCLSVYLSTFLPPVYIHSDIACLSGILPELPLPWTCCTCLLSSSICATVIPLDFQISTLSSFVLVLWCLVVGTAKTPSRGQSLKMFKGDAAYYA